MKNWQIALLFAAAFLIVGLIDRPEYYRFELKNMPPVKHETLPIKERVLLVENLLKTTAKPVYSPSPIVWK